MTEPRFHGNRRRDQKNGALAAGRPRQRERRLVGEAGVCRFNGSSSIRINAGCPARRHKSLAGYELAADPIEDIKEPVLRCLHDDFALRAIDVDVGENHVLGCRVVPGLAGRRLVMPDVFPCIRPQRDNRGEKQVVAAVGVGAIRGVPID